MTIYKEKLKASVQYDDLIGTTAADRADKNDLEAYLVAKGLIKRPNELIVAVRFWSGENHRGPVSDASITVVIADVTGYETLDELLKDRNRPRFRGVRLEMTNDEFFGCFKRFSVVLHLPKYDDLIGSEFEVEFDDE